MPPLPVMLNVQNRRCVVVGGGPVALRRTLALLEAGAVVTVISPASLPDLTSLPIELHSRPYHRDDLADAMLVVIATDDAQVNEQVAKDAHEAGVLINRADMPERGDFVAPAHCHHGPITLAVGTNGVSARAAAVIRDQLADALDADWITLLTCAGEHRRLIQQQVADPAQRRDLLLRLADDRAMTILKDQGESALRAYYKSFCPGPIESDPGA